MILDEKQVYRVQFRFWLDVVRPEEDQLAEYVTHLKEKRSFAQTIRDALCLIRDLRQGRVEVLLRLFPWIEEHFAKSISQPTVMTLPDPLREHMERMEHYFNQLPAARPLLLAQPAEKDEDTTIEMKRVTNGKSVWNALISVAALNNTFGDLPTNVLNYGIEIGRIPAHFERKTASLVPIQTEGGPKAMAVPQFANPVFDDDNDDDLLIKG